MWEWLWLGMYRQCGSFLCVHSAGYIYLFTYIFVRKKDREIDICIGIYRYRVRKAVREREKAPLYGFTCWSQMAKTRCYRIDFDLFPAAIGRGCANVALNLPLLPLGRALFSFRSSFFSRLGLGLRLRLRLRHRHRLHFLVAFVVVVVVGATSAPFAS